MSVEKFVKQRRMDVDDFQGVGTHWLEFKIIANIFFLLLLLLLFCLCVSRGKKARRQRWRLWSEWAPMDGDDSTTTRGNSYVEIDANLLSSPTGCFVSLLFRNNIQMKCRLTLNSVSRTTCLHTKEERNFHRCCSWVKTDGQRHVVNFNFTQFLCCRPFEYLNSF